MAGFAPTPEEFDFETLPELIEWALTLDPDLTALIDGSVEFTYMELAAQMSGVAVALRQQGVKEGDRVVIWSGNDWQWVVTALSIWWIGAVLVPFSERLVAMEAEDLLRRIKPSFIFIGSGKLPYEEHARVVASHSSAIETLSGGVYWGVEDDIPAGFSRWEDFVHEPLNELPSPALVTPEALCNILCTSGTTGRPKCVMHGHAALMTMAACLRLPTDACYPHMFLGHPPLSHSFGLYLLVGCLGVGGTYVVSQGIHNVQLADLIERHQITWVSAPPPILQWLWNEMSLRPDVLSSLEVVGTGGTFIPPDVIGNYLSLGLSFVVSGYGLTESPVVSQTRRNATSEVICTTVGQPHPMVQVTLVDDSEQVVDADQVGEIVIDSPANMLGYLDDPDATAEAFTAKGQLKTGDMGQWTPGGQLRIVGRKKDMFISFGFNVYPAEVEYQLLASNMLEDVAVVARDNKLVGQEGAAFLVPKFPDAFDLGEIRTWVRKNMARFKQPVKYHILEVLPRNANGKVDKIELASRL
ncbi:MAG: AMP-binding protein [Pseudomonadales bacterium]